MADYLVTDTELTSIADAIRTKGGTSASLIFPTGFVNAIDAIPSGGGVEFASISVSGMNIYYTDENMVAQTSVGSVIDVKAPIGSIVTRYGAPEPFVTNVGVTQMASWSSGPIAVYKVTG